MTWNQKRQVCVGRASIRKRKKRIRCHTFPVEKSFKILGYIFNPAEKMQDILDAECKQSMVERRKQSCTVENKIGSESWTWSRAAQERIKGWETKVMRRPFRFKRRRKNR